MSEQELVQDIRERQQNIFDRIRIATKRAGRSTGSVRLCVVTKGHSSEAIAAVIAAGATDLGENYVQEALTKMDELSNPPGVRWHMIGHIQSRKAAQVTARFAWAHSVDSLKLARKLNRFAGENGTRLNILLEYNVSGEAAKYGWDAADTGNWQELIAEVEEIVGFEYIRVRGLMTMAPFVNDPQLARPYFERLRLLAEFFKSNFGEEYFSQLSMGMSQDFEVAIQEGATILRIGQAIMGPRPQVKRRE